MSSGQKPGTLPLFFSIVLRTKDGDPPPSFFLLYSGQMSIHICKADNVLILNYSFRINYYFQNFTTSEAEYVRHLHARYANCTHVTPNWTHATATPLQSPPKVMHAPPNWSHYTPSARTCTPPAREAEVLARVRKLHATFNSLHADMRLHILLYILFNTLHEIN